MGTLAISFRFADDSTRDERYEDFMRYFQGKTVWLETTSFILLKTDETYNIVANALFMTKFNSATDKLLVIDVTDDRAAAWGKMQNTTLLKSLLPNIVMV
jgi:hypothetical protein